MTTYTLRTSASRSDPLIAVGLGELAELIGCAMAEGDTIDTIDTIDAIAATDGAGDTRPLTRAERHQLVERLGRQDR